MPMRSSYQFLNDKTISFRFKSGPNSYFGGENLISEFYQNGEVTTDLEDLVKKAESLQIWMVVDTGRGILGFLIENQQDFDEHLGEARKARFCDIRFYRNV